MEVRLEKFHKRVCRAVPRLKAGGRASRLPNDSQEPGSSLLAISDVWMHTAIDSGSFAFAWEEFGLFVK